MRVLQRYVLQELSRVWLLAFAAMTLVFTLAVGLQRLHQVGVSFSLLLKVLPLLALRVFPYTLPIAAVLAATLVYGKLSADREILALRAAGVHLGRIILPALLLGVGLSLLSTFLTLVVIPESKYRVSMLARAEVTELLESLLAGRIDRISRFRFCDFQTTPEGKMQRVIVIQYQGRTRVRRIRALEAVPHVELDQGRLTFRLKDGSITSLPSLNTSLNTSKIDFDSYEAVIPLTGMQRSPKIKELPVNKLSQAIRNLRGEEKLQAQVELHGRFALGLAPLLFLLVGAPIGIIAKQAHMLGAFALCCLPVFLVYYPLMMLMEVLSSEGRALPQVAAWVPAAVLALIGAELLAVLFRR